MYRTLPVSRRVALRPAICHSLCAMDAGDGAQLQFVLEMAAHVCDLLAADQRLGFNHVIDLVRNGTVQPQTLLQVLKDIQRGSGGTSARKAPRLRSRLVARRPRAKHLVVRARGRRRRRRAKHLVARARGRRRGHRAKLTVVRPRGRRRPLEAYGGKGEAFGGKGSWLAPPTPGEAYGGKGAWHPAFRGWESHFTSGKAGAWQQPVWSAFAAGKGKHAEWGKSVAAREREKERTMDKGKGKGQGKGKKKGGMCLLRTRKRKPCIV